MINLYDRIKEFTYTIGTGDISLYGAVRGFSTFSSAYSNSGELFYAITDGTNYEIGSGLYLSSPNAIKRYPFKSSNSNNLVNFTEGFKEVYVTCPATNLVFNTSGISTIPKDSGVAFWQSENSVSYSDKLVFNSNLGRLGVNNTNPSFAVDVGGNLASSQIRSSGFVVGQSGVFFQSGNNGVSSYSGGRQLVHFEPNQLVSPLTNVLQLSGIVNQHISLKQQNANMVFAGPSGGCGSPPCNPNFPSFRYLVEDDIPDLSHLYGVLSKTICDGRLSLSSTESVFSGSGTILHYVPHNGNQITLYNGQQWQTLVFSSQVVVNFTSLSANTIYDVFAYIDNNVLTFETVPWIMFNSNWESLELTPEVSKRSINLVKFQGILSKTGDSTKRYIGSFKTTSGGFADTNILRLIYNQYNKVNKTVFSNLDYDGEVSFEWTYTSTGGVRYIPYIQPVEILNGYDSYVDLKAVLNAYVESINTEYVLGIVRSPEIYYHAESSNYGDIIEFINNNGFTTEYSSVILIGSDGYITTDKISGTYADTITKTLQASIYYKPLGYEKFYATEITLANSPIMSHDSTQGTYGIIGTYSC